MIRLEDGVWRVEGPVRVDTAHALLQETEAIWQSDTFSIDLSGIGEVDSAVVALLLAWRRRALRIGKQVTFLNQTDSVRSLVVLYDLSDLLFSAESAST